MTPELRTAFLVKAYSAALESGHIYPGVAAAGCAVESAWGTSQLAVKANNLFGLKKPQAWRGEVLTLPTRQFLHGEWVMVTADWPVFSSWSECFKEQMAALHRVPRYAAALAATTTRRIHRAGITTVVYRPQSRKRGAATYRVHLNVLAPIKEAA